MNIKEQYQKYLSYDAIIHECIKQMRIKPFSITCTQDFAKACSEYTEVFRLDNLGNDDRIMKLEVLKTRNRRGS